MAELCWGILFLSIAAAVNWAMGLYKKIGVEKIRWDWREFLRGLVKIALIIGSVIGLGIIWKYSGIDLSGAGLEPLTMTTTATVYFSYKAVRYLETIFQISPQGTDSEEK